MWKFILLSFGFLSWGFYELSGGSEFEPKVAQETPIRILAVYDVPEGSTQTIASVLEESGLSVAPLDDTIVELTPLAVATTVDNPAPNTATVASIQPEEVAAAIVEQPEIVISQATQIDVKVVDANNLNMRSGPSTNNGVITRLERDTEVEIIDQNAEGWANIKVLLTGEEGWVSARYLTDAAN